MNKEVIGLIVGTIVIFLSFVFVCGPFFSSIFGIRSWSALPSHPYRERLSAIAVFVEGYPPIVEYTVDGISYRENFAVFYVQNGHNSVGTTKFFKGLYKRRYAGTFDHSYSNSFVPSNAWCRPISPSFGADSLVWSRQADHRAYVERYSGMDQVYKWFGIGFGLALVLVYGIVISAFFVQFVQDIRIKVSWLKGNVTSHRASGGGQSFFSISMLINLSIWYRGEVASYKYRQEVNFDKAPYSRYNEEKVTKDKLMTNSKVYNTPETFRGSVTWIQKMIYEDVTAQILLRSWQQWNLALSAWIEMIITENLPDCINQPLDDPEAQKERLEKAIRYLIKRK